MSEGLKLLEERLAEAKAEWDKLARLCSEAETRLAGRRKKFEDASRRVTELERDVRAVKGERTSLRIVEPRRI